MSDEHHPDCACPKCVAEARAYLRRMLPWLIGIPAGIAVLLILVRFLQ